MNTVFYVDDDRLMREMLGRALEKEHFDVQLFTSPHDLLANLDSGCPDIVISDVQMPSMTGLEMIREIRDRGLSVPVIVVTGRVIPEVEKEAKKLGVSHVVAKPVKDFGRLSSMVRDAILGAKTTELRAGLDDLRLGFLTELSHELRTPLTAIKIALDGMVAQRSGSMDASQQKLIDITQRNVDRIISHVENQLDLLQITLGDIRVSRRLTGLLEVLESTLRTHGHEGGSSMASDSVGDRSMFMFTDPDRLQGIIKYIFDNGRRGHRVEIRTDAIVVEGRQVVALVFSNTDILNTRIGRMDFESSDPAGTSLSNTSVGGVNFEFRACQTLVEALGGDIRIEDEGANERIHLQLPVYPDYDRKIDFVNSLADVRKAAALNGKRLALIKCETSSGADDASGKEANAVEAEFLQRCLLTLAHEDVVVRGRRKGRYYVGLLERPDDQVQDIVGFLQESLPPSIGDTTASIEAVLLSWLLPHEEAPEEILRELETVI